VESLLSRSLPSTKVAPFRTSGTRPVSIDASPLGLGEPRPRRPSRRSLMVLRQAIVQVEAVLGAPPAGSSVLTVC
jgi:hypothetical protein